jgi:hypothetical protein
MVPALEQKRGYTAWHTSGSAAGYKIIILETGHSIPIKKKTTAWTFASWNFHMGLFIFSLSMLRAQ